MDYYQIDRAIVIIPVNPGGMLPSFRFHTKEIAETIVEKSSFGVQSVQNNASVLTSKIYETN